MAELKHKILFVCVHNSARSQMAEAFVNEYGGEDFIAESAGLEPGRLNPNVVEVMKEAGIDISKKSTQSVFDLLKRGSFYHAVISVCDMRNAERCPTFPGMVKRIAWSFEDPSSLQGSREEILEQTRKIRDQVREKALEFINEAKQLSYWI